MKIGDKVKQLFPTYSKESIIKNETKKQYILDDNNRYWKHNNRLVGCPKPMLGAFLKEYKQYT
jgi:hypothetical protein